MSENMSNMKAPEYLAQAAVLLLFLEPESRCSRCFRGTVPVHARYHRPADCLSCLAPGDAGMLSLGQLSAECWEPAEVNTPCSSDTTSSCQWHTTKHTPVKLMLRVPVGHREHSSLVCALTLLTTGLCSGLILAAACKYGHFSQ
uniref:Phosphatidylinositol-glycan biosynthesis class X protein n=1 Tax=Junco hyemalis TaxID=40217 RepID=A0A8C5JT50_JUNHY